MVPVGSDSTLNDTIGAMAVQRLKGLIHDGHPAEARWPDKPWPSCPMGLGTGSTA